MRWLHDWARGMADAGPWTGPLCAPCTSRREGRSYVRSVHERSEACQHSERRRAGPSVSVGGWWPEPASPGERWGRRQRSRPARRRWASPRRWGRIVRGMRVGAESGPFTVAHRAAPVAREQRSYCHIPSVIGSRRACPRRRPRRRRRALHRPFARLPGRLVALHELHRVVAHDIGPHDERDDRTPPSGVGSSSVMRARPRRRPTPSPAPRHPRTRRSRSSDPPACRGTP